MFTYELLIKRYLDDRNIRYRMHEEELICCCPFHDEKHPSFVINCETGAYICYACEEQGSITNFVAKMENISTSEAWKLIQEETRVEFNGKTSWTNSNFKKYTLEDYAKEKSFDIKYLKEILKIEDAEDGKSIRIPYSDENLNYIGARRRNSPDSDVRFWWEKGTKVNLYGIWGLKGYDKDYVILVEGESDCHALWQNDIQAIGVPGAKHFKKEYSQYFTDFKKIYIHSEEDRGSENFIEKVCKALPYEKLYIIKSKAVDEECKDPSDLFKKGILDLNTLLSTAEKVDKDYYNEVNEKERKKMKYKEEGVHKHVQIAEQVMQKINIRFYKGDFYIYENGVYHNNLQGLERVILEVDNNLRKSERAEVLDYIRIKQGKDEIEINEDYINYKNGLFSLKENKLYPHTPDIFTTCQVNINYLKDEEIIVIESVEKFLKDIAFNNEKRIKALLQITGYSMTSRVDLQQAFIFYGPTARNGKSTVIEIINTIIGRENICHITVHQLLKRFTIAELTNKLLNTETEIATDLITNMEVFKKIVTGDEISVEQKYKDRYIIKPFAKFIFGTNSLPTIEDDDEGYFRRLNILLFEKQFTREEELSFDKSELLTQEALDYFGNRALREYMKIIPTRTLANEEESQRLISDYREENDSVNSFLDDDREMAKVFEFDNKVQKVAIYRDYAEWCGKYNYTPIPKKEFFKKVLKRAGFSSCKVNGYDYIRNANEKSAKEKDKDRKIFGNF